MSVYYQDSTVTLHHGHVLDVLPTLPDASVDCVVTSPPYFGLRDYGVDGQIGAEASPAEYVETIRAVFAEVRRVLADDGTVWINLGDSYSAGMKETKIPPYGKGPDKRGPGKQYGTGIAKAASDVPPKNLLGMPWRVAFALQSDDSADVYARTNMNVQIPRSRISDDDLGHFRLVRQERWILRNAIVWHKPNAMPESVTDRLSTRYEMLFMFSKSRKYWFDIDPIREGYSPAGLARRAYSFRSTDEFGKNPVHAGGDIPANALGKNPGDVWEIPTSPFPGAHFATFPSELPRRCIVAGCKPGGTVLDPFHGSGTTGMVATRNGRKYVGIELNKDYLDLSLRTRLADGVLDFEEPAS